MDWFESEIHYGGNLGPYPYLSRKKYIAATITGEHVPNKNEAKMLRRLKAETGLTEEQLREHYKYRKMLSDAQKRQGGETRVTRKRRDVMKKITKELKLPKEHPLVVERYNKEIEDIRKGYGWLSYHI